MKKAVIVLVNILATLLYSQPGIIWDKTFCAKYVYTMNLPVDGNPDPPPGRPVSKEINVNENTPSEFSLYGNYPNPFNISTTIEFGIPNESIVRVSIFNMLGQKIKSWYHSSAFPGKHKIIWDGKNKHGTEVSSGTYIIYLTALSKENNSLYSFYKKIQLVK